MLFVTRFGLLGVWLALGLVGCSGSTATDRKPTLPVSGTITMAGGPVADAFVTFSPQSGQPVAIGRTDTSGKYALTTYEAGDGAVAGDYVVMVIKETAAGGGKLSEEDYHKAYMSGQISSSHAGSGSAGAGLSALPEKYSKGTTSDLRTSVKAEQEVYDFELKP